MAPIGALVSCNPKSKYHTHPESSKIGSIIFAAILAVLVPEFICIFLYEYRKGSPLYFLSSPNYYLSLAELQDWQITALCLDYKNADGTRATPPQ
jgi:hypothetical protein